MSKLPDAGTVHHAKSSNPISKIFKSILGVFIGILIILLVAPVALWYAESQDTAKIFSHSKQVSSTSGASGFIRTSDIASLTSPNTCYKGKISGDCIYYSYTLQELQYSLQDYCGDLSSNQVVVEKKGEKCRRDSNDDEICEQCYVVNQSDWNVIESETKFMPFSVGNFKISNPATAKLIGAEFYENAIDSKHKESMNYVKDKSTLLVSGKSDGSSIADGGKKNYLLISTKGYEETYQSLRATDIMIGWILRILAFVILFLGYKMIFGPISTMSNYVRKIPFIGKFIDNAVGFVISLVSFILALVHFIVLWILIILIKNILYIALIVGLIVLGFYLYTKFVKGKK